MVSTSQAEDPAPEAQDAPQSNLFVALIKLFAASIIILFAIGVSLDFHKVLNDIRIVYPVLLNPTQEYPTRSQGDLFVPLQRWGCAGGSVHHLQ